MSLPSFLYTYKQVGVVEKDGVKYKKFVKVPLIRSKHRAAAGQAVLVVLLGALAFKFVGWFFDRDARSADSGPSQYQGFE